LKVEPDWSLPAVSEKDDDEIIDDDEAINTNKLPELNRRMGGSGAGGLQRED